MTVSGDGRFILTSGTDGAMYVMEVHDAKPQTRAQELDGAMQREGFDVGMVVRSEMMELDEQVMRAHEM